MYDFSLEKKLKNEAPEVHRRMQDDVSILRIMLESFFTWFPDFTDHSVLHSLDVLNFCNAILAEQVEELTVAECFSLIMSCYLHDMGMGINESDYNEFIKQLNITEYMKKHPEAEPADIIRVFHHEFSGLFIRKYANLFEILTDEVLFAIIQISRGHRKTDLLDEKEYPVLNTKYGIIRTAYISAVMRLADEIDVGADRNPELLFNPTLLTKQADIDAFGTHESIKNVEVTEKKIILHVTPKEPRFIPLIEKLADKIQNTLDYCREVASKRSELQIHQEIVEIRLDCTQ